MHMKRILIASDDVHTRAWVASSLDPLDVSIEESSVGDLASRLTSEDFTLVAVDGGRDPEPLVQVFERIASEGLDVRLLLLIEAEALPGLRVPSTIGADFMVRGGTSGELAARVRTLLWPGEEASGQELIRVDDLTVNLATYQVYIEGRSVDFTYLEYALFAFLVTHPNRAYSREVLLRRVWGSDYYGGLRTVDVHIRRVRAKIDAHARRLETVRNVGYLWHG